MSKKELDRYEIIKRLLRKEINGVKAANLLRLSVRQVKRLKARVKARGATGLVHGNRGQLSHHRLPEKEREKIKQLLHRHYYDFGPTLASEKLTLDHRLDYDPKTIRQIMIDEELWKPKAKKEKQTHRSWRERKSAYGEMIQFDGSYEHWLENRGGSGEICLLAAIDDATGKITKARFVKDEGVFPVFDFWKDYLSKQGRPCSIYLDKFSTYKMNQKVAVENHDLKTQFERAAHELGIGLIFANSPQAKGRVERLFSTLQDRLIKELRLAKISTVEAANDFLEKIFLPSFNIQFAVEPRSQANLHCQLAVKEQKQLESIFSRQTERVAQNDFTVSFKNQWYQLVKDQPVTVCRKDKLMVEERLDGSICFRLRGKYLNYQLLPERPKRAKRIPWILPATAIGLSRAHKPAPDHPWRKHFSLNTKV